MSLPRTVHVECPKEGCREPHTVHVMETFGGVNTFPSNCTRCGATLHVPSEVIQEVVRENERTGKRY